MSTSRVDHWADVRNREFVSPKPHRPSMELDAAKQRIAEQDAALAALCLQIESMQAGQGPFGGHRLACAVAKAHGLSYRQLIAKRRNRNLVYARQHAMWEIRNATTLSLPQIGLILGGMDHTTVLWGIRRHQARIESGEVRG